MVESYLVQKLGATIRIMALLLEQSIFIHTPKTGGSWVREALKRSGIQTSEKLCDWHEGEACEWSRGVSGERMEFRHICTHNALHQINPDGLFTFGFVRHPVSFFASYWMYKMMHGWDTANGADGNLQSDSFEQFIWNVLKVDPLFAADIYGWFLLDGGVHADFIGKQEHLADDLVTALQLAGETFDEELLRSTPLVNASDSEWKDKLDCSPELLAELCMHNRPIMERFGYEPILSFKRNHTAALSLV